MPGCRDGRWYAAELAGLLDAEAAAIAHTGYMGANQPGIVLRLSTRSAAATVPAMASRAGAR
jgi:hypothetical protein